jgi:NADH dehydrogenase FAD-containing subunit
MSSSNIVIVGAGTGGFLLYKKLAAKLANTNYNLIVVEPRKFYVHQPSSLRMVVSSVDGYEDKSIMNHPSDLSSEKVRFVYAKATSISDNGSDGGRVTLDNDESIDYAVLVVATGSRWSDDGPVAFGTEKDKILEHVTSWRAKFKDAQDIVLVGGGAIGFGKFPP